LRHTDRGWGATLLVALLALPVGASLFLFNPETAGLFPPCPSRWLTGLSCPGCGTLRALHHLLNGNLMIALGFNPLMIASLPLLGWMWFRPAWMFQRWAPWTVFTVLLAYGVLRNVLPGPWA
jgi:hypothetical protein